MRRTSCAGVAHPSGPPGTAAATSFDPARAEIAMAPAMIQWSPRPVASWRKSKRSSTTPYRTRPMTKRASAGHISQVSRSAVATVAARTTMAWVATHTR